MVITKNEFSFMFSDIIETADLLLVTKRKKKKKNIRYVLRSFRSCTALLSVPRYFFTDQHNVTELQLHGFCDASIQTYSAVFYVRLSKNDNIVTNLLTAKSKIVPNRK